VSHAFVIQEEIQKTVRHILRGLNEHNNCAQIKSPSKLTVYSDYGLKLEVVVRCPMEARELEEHRESQKRKAAWKANRK
jgi:hypothetical protein